MFGLNKCLIGFCIIMAADASASARILSVAGEVKVRRGMEETWKPAVRSMLLDDMDSILSGEASEALLEMEDGRTFRLGGNAMLDIADLRIITEQQLFLFLTAQKIRNLDPSETDKPIRIQNVSAVRAEDRSVSGSGYQAADNLFWRQETNAVLSMIAQAYYPNAVMKAHKILDVHAKSADKARLYFYLGQSFESLEDRGRALEAYQASIGYCKPDQQPIRTEAAQSIRRIKDH